MSDTPPNRRSVSVDHFSTDRLTAERLREDHLADLVALHRDAEVSRFLGGVRTPEVTSAYLATNMAHWDQHGFGLWTLRRKDGAFAGRAGIRHILVDDVDEIEIAYAFKREFWGQGFASEIATALTDIGLLQLALPSLIGIVYIGNAASRRVLEKSNYLLERSANRHGNDVVIYRIRR
ncbi:N-acetyltransferase [Bradyrhizobium sp. WBAH42]|nr:N-acetyltransferase [Bradyrhizobium sp. WBAH30]MDD1545928.1 N-acetyltransferase [Bradyrhizobium sp. WBAH41]MDD1559118.1 N-acetyltransferase [Bradyrhizobium sp. WBAH23]MDD1566218.1 N-acetyltransferase [Bradyrhizobium sp. WBAH33]MDD1591816.1 N-acetyltransferase [Bradyrhizobium sp. WBAH42]NRB89891.1 N-acetyltransferase [Bradyrhizobium sp. WBAH10]QCJ93166.1 N-acetyltransferase [Bradyrhizobium yuanmingense]